MPVRAVSVSFGSALRGGPDDAALDDKLERRHRRPKRPRSFVRQDGGAVAVEFAFVVPVILALLFLGFEASRVASAAMRLNDSAQMLADLVSRQTTVTAGQIGDFCSGIKLAMTPLPTTGFRATIASVTHSTAGFVVDWQDASCGPGAPMVSPAALATAFIPSVNDSIIVVQASYDYHPLVSSTVSPSVALVRTSYARVRGGSSVSHQ